MAALPVGIITNGSATVPQAPAAPARMKCERGVCPAPGVNTPPKLVRLSQIAPGRSRLPLPGQSKSGVPVISPATSRRPDGRMPATISAFTPAASTAPTVPFTGLKRAFVRTSALLMKYSVPGGREPSAPAADRSAATISGTVLPRPAVTPSMVDSR